MLSGHFHVKVRGWLLRQVHAKSVLVTGMTCIFIWDDPPGLFTLGLIEQEELLVMERLSMGSLPFPVGNMALVDMVEGRIRSHRTESPGLTLNPEVFIYSPRIIIHLWMGIMSRHLGRPHRKQICTTQTNTEHVSEMNRRWTRGRRPQMWDWYATLRGIKKHRLRKRDAPRRGSTTTATTLICGGHVETLNT
jgi:hypothetical protein